VALELDCQVLIDAIKGKLQAKSSLAHLVSEIKDLVNGSRITSIVGQVTVSRIL
jgi:hypothetical protein